MGIVGPQEFTPTAAPTEIKKASEVSDIRKTLGEMLGWHRHENKHENIPIVYHNIDNIGFSR